MTHVGQKLGFGPRGGFRGDPGGFEFAVGLRQLVLKQFVAERGADARAELGDFIRFGDIIHRAELETAQLVGRAVPSGENDDRDVLQVRVFLQLLEHREPVVLREAEVQQDDVDFIAPRQREAVAPVAGTQKLDAVIDQAGNEQIV